MSKFEITKSNIQYPRLQQLGVTIYGEPYPHLKPKELNIALANAKINQAMVDNGLYGQTGIIVDGECCSYPWDVEAIIERHISGQRTGTQLWWD